MGIIAKLKDVLGIADRPARPRRAESTDVTVDREADASTEEAVKGVETGTDEEATTETADAGEQETTPTEPPASDDGDGVEDGEPVDSIKGIGASYAERLGAAGVHTVADLAAADAEELAKETGIGAGRIGNWIERAQVRDR